MWPNFLVNCIRYRKVSCLYPQILKSQDLPAKPRDSSAVSPTFNTSQDQLPHSELETLGQPLEVDLPGPVVGLGLALPLGGGTAVTSSLTRRLDFSSSRCMGQGIGVCTLDPDTQRRLSLQEPPINSQTPKRHSSDPGGS